jgi:hypothetical protein
VLSRCGGNQHECFHEAHDTGAGSGTTCHENEIVLDPAAFAT